MVRISYQAVTVADMDVTVDLTVEGDPEADAEKVALYARDRAVRALQALRDGDHPDDADGTGVGVRWDWVVGDGSADAPPALDDVNLTPDTLKYRVASAVLHADGAVTASDVVFLLEGTEWAYKDKASVSRTLKSLLDDDVLSRRKRDGDGPGMAYEYRPTEDGKTVIYHAQKRADRTYGDVSNEGLGALFNNDTHDDENE